MKLTLSSRERNALARGLPGLVVLAVVVQLWLLWTTVDAYRLGDESASLEKALISLGCLVLNVGAVFALRAVNRTPAT
jgi:hypothetical protein